MRIPCGGLILAVGLSVLAAAQQKSPSDDPFADVAAAPANRTDRAVRRGFFAENFGFRKEVMSQFTWNEDYRGASRQSVGFEVLKKFSTATSTIASFNFQGRMVRRDGFNLVSNDMEGANRRGWFFEYHNFYADFYNVLNPVLGEAGKGRNSGRFNVRLGRFYLPFGLNLQTDTHGTVLQLSNERNFGFERDWYTGLWGSINKHINYDVYYMLGSGYDLSFKGQRGIAAGRISLGNRYSANYGLEGGVSVLGGERLSMDATRRPIETRRAGVDARYRRAVPSGSLGLTSELSAGSDERRDVKIQLYQSEYLHASRRWGSAAQYRRYTRALDGADASLAAEFTWFLRNDAGNSSLHWIKFNVERRIGRATHMRPATVAAIQYYIYR